MVFILYLRVSTEDQRRRGYSLPEQRESCRARARALAEAAGAQAEILEFTDDMSGSIIAAREQLEAARAVAVGSGESWFICMHPDRFARDLKGQLMVYDELRSAGVRVEFVDVEFADSLEGRLFFQVIGAIAEFERGKIRERTTRGRLGKLKAGGIASRVEPYGFAWNAEADRLEPIPAELEWVRRMFRWAAGVDGERLGPAQIADQLDRLGAPTKRGGRWNRTTVRKILRNSVYAGRLVLNRTDFRGLEIWRRVPLQRRPKVKGRDGRERPLTVTARTKPPEEWFTVFIDPVVDPRLWSTAQGYLDKARRTAQPSRHPLAGLTVCGLCKGPVRAMQSRRRYLRCSRRYPKDMGFADWDSRPACTLPHLQADPIEDGVWAEVHGWILDPGSLRRKAEQLRTTGAAAPRRRRELLDAAALIRRQMEENQAAQGRILGLVERGSVDLAAAERRLRPLQRQLSALQEELRAAEARAAAIPQPTDAENLVQSAESLGAAVREAISSLDPDQRREILRRLVEKVVVHRDGTWEVVPRA